MPIFEYRCAKCAHQFELLVMKTTVPACPKCASTELEKEFSLPAIKGDGTHARALQSAYKRNTRVGAEREHGQREYEKNHDDH